jgi:hypothetical protein
MTRDDMDAHCELWMTSAQNNACSTKVGACAERDKALSMIAQALRCDRSRKTRTLVAFFDLSVSHCDGRVAVLALSWK